MMTMIKNRDLTIKTKINQRKLQEKMTTRSGMSSRLTDKVKLNNSITVARRKLPSVPRLSMKVNRH